jgi:hypothetical protein
MLTKFSQLSLLFMGVDYKFIIISSRSNIFFVRTPSQSTYLLWMSPISVNKFWSHIPNTNMPIFRTASQKICPPIQTANSTCMTSKISQFFLRWKINQINFSIIISNSYCIASTKTNWTNLFTKTCLINFYSL